MSFGLIPNPFGSLFSASASPENSLREKLIDAEERILRRLGGMSPDRAVEARALTEAIQRHVSTFPTNDAERATWLNMAQDLLRQSRRFTGISPLAAAMILGGLVLVGFAAFMWLDSSGKLGGLKSKFKPRFTRERESEED